LPKVINHPRGEKSPNPVTLLTTPSLMVLKKKLRWHVVLARRGGIASGKET
jgi:hypothetical protein